MVVIFVSLSEKKARLKTQKVLDLYADRIGNQTWRTNITQEGLKAVKTHLCKTASKNTSVACHWVHKSKTTELLWVVGSKSKFTFDGVVPIATTKNDLLHNSWENNDKYLELIKCIVAISALFHDFGKASDGFQKMLKGSLKTDCIRHEYISYLIFSLFIKDKSDDIWLKEFSDNTLENLNKRISNEIKKNGVNFTEKNSITNLGKLISLLILSHHKKPLLYGEKNEKAYLGAKCNNLDIFFYKYLDENWGYLKAKCIKSDYLNKFSKGLIFSKTWRKEVSKWSSRLLNHLSLFEEAEKNEAFPLILEKARLYFMLGDYYFSSKQKDDSYKEKTIKLFANTDKKSNEYKQYLEEHLVGVEKEALKIIYTLNRSLRSFPVLDDIKSIKKSSLKTSKYYWQDKVANKLRTISEDNKTNCGFFCVNLASTGTGKTFANAKIINSIMPETGDLRFSIALGLRTLTLQTGDMYRNKMHIDKTDLAVLIGSKAVEQLHEINEGEFDIEDLSFDDIDYANIISDNSIKTIIKSEKQNKMLCAPILVSTIDHLIPATDCVVGGKWILPFLRILSSDLIIDEIDDFSDKDLICISRLVNMAGQLGRKVIISSATITPSIAMGFYQSYIQGRKIYDSYYSLNNNVISCFVDEFSNKVFESEIDFEMNIFKTKYYEFIENRIKQIQASEKVFGIKRKGKILEFSKTLTKNEVFSCIFDSIETLHKDNYVIDDKTLKKVSIGVIRFAHIQNCIEFCKQLDLYESDNLDIKFISYHSRHMLLVRNEIERYLDKILYRGNEAEDKVCFNDNIINNHIEKSKKNNVVFVVVATPVEEVGRDHDFDWAIVEPSSYRSIIQLAGRVLRHRNKFVNNPNIFILQYNLNSLNKDDSFVFHNPGYEINNSIKLNSHDLKQIIDEKGLNESINSIPRLKEVVNKKNQFINLEHQLIQSYLLPLETSLGPESVNGYYYGCWSYTGLPQEYARFRDAKDNIKIYILMDDDERLNFFEKEDNQNMTPVKKTYDLKFEDSIVNNAWLNFDYHEIVEFYAEQLNLSKNKVMNIYCYLEIPKNYLDNKYSYSIYYGMFRR